MQIAQVELTRDGDPPREESIFVTGDGDIYALASSVLGDRDGVIRVDGMAVVVDGDKAYVSLRGIQRRFPWSQDIVEEAFATEIYRSTMAMLAAAKEESDDDADVIAYPTRD